MTLLVRVYLFVDNETMENQNGVIDIIIELVKGVKNDNHIESEYKGKALRLGGSRYLLNQVIRYYTQPWSHYYFSKNAIALWKEITTEPMTAKFYRNRVDCDIGKSIEIIKFKGASKTGEPHIIEPRGDWFYFREVFHDEHMITINDIIDELVSLENLDAENVISVLDKIYICRMMKTEDKLRKPQRKRGLDLEYIINHIYRPCGIEVIPYQNLPAEWK